MSGRSRFILACVLMLGVLGSPAWAEPDSHPLPPPPKVRAWQTGLLRADRLHHASFALSSGLAFGVITRKPSVAFGSAMALGLVKEAWDSRRGRFDFVDIAADALGAGAATIITYGVIR